jgi:hypothetical protein
VFRNKVDEHGTIVRNKFKLDYKGYNKEKGIDYEKTFAPVARVESIKILLVYDCHVNFTFSKWILKMHFKWIYHRISAC